MNKSKKHACGLAGLGLVAAITAIAYGVPAPQPAFADTSNSASVGINVTVFSEEPMMDITHPADGVAISGHSINVTVSYNHITWLSYVLSIVNPDGSTTVVEESEDVLVAESPDDLSNFGTHVFNINMSDQSYGDYLFTVRSKTYSGSGYYGEDTIELTYQSAAIDDEESGIIENDDGTVTIPTDEETGDPEVIIEHGDEVDHFEVQIKDPVTGEVIFTFEVEVPAGESIDSTTIRIPVSQNPALAEKLKELGNYELVITPKDEDGNVVGKPIELEVKYQAPGEPSTDDEDEVIIAPDTGALTIGDLTISRADFLVSGLIVFGAAAAGGLFILGRHSRATRKRR